VYDLGGGVDAMHYTNQSNCSVVEDMDDQVEFGEMVALRLRARTRVVCDGDRCISSNRWKP
jgi:hypothetical protein